MFKQVFLALFAVIVFAPLEVDAFVEPPTITPERPSASSAITVHVRAGGCHGFVLDEGEPELRRNGNHLDLIAPGIASLPPGHPLCIYPAFTSAFPIGNLEAGEYTLAIHILDSGFPDTPVAFGMVAFQVMEPFSTTTIPAIGRSAALTLMMLLIAAGAIALQSKEAAQ